MFTFVIPTLRITSERNCLEIIVYATKKGYRTVVTFATALVSDVPTHEISLVKGNNVMASCRHSTLFNIVQQSTSITLAEFHTGGGGGGGG